MKKLSHSLSGSLSIYEVGVLKEECLRLISDQESFLLDCTEVSFCDTAFLQLLCSLARLCKKRKIDFSLKAGTVVLEASSRIGLRLAEEMHILDGEQ